LIDLKEGIRFYEMIFMEMALKERSFLLDFCCLMCQQQTIVGSFALGSVWFSSLPLTWLLKDPSKKITKHKNLSLPIYSRFSILIS